LQWVRKERIIRLWGGGGVWARGKGGPKRGKSPITFFFGLRLKRKKRRKKKEGSRMVELLTREKVSKLKSVQKN